MTLIQILVVTTLFGTGMWGVACYYKSKQGRLVFEVQDDLTGLKNFKVITTVGKKVVSMTSKTKKEATSILVEKRERFMNQGFLVGKIEERNDSVFFAHQKDEHLTTTSIGFAPQKPEYPLGTVGYVWQNMYPNERYLKRLLRMENGKYVCTRYDENYPGMNFDNFSPLDIYDELAEVNLAFDNLVIAHCREICASDTSLEGMAGVVKTIGLGFRKGAAQHLTLNRVPK